MDEKTFFYPIMTGIFRIRMNAIKRMRLFWVKLSKYSLNGNRISLRISLLKVDLTISAHRECYNGIDALNSAPDSSLTLSGHGDMRHVYRFGL